MDQQININTLYCDVFENIANTGDTSLLGCSDHVDVWDAIIVDYHKEIGNNSQALIARKRIELAKLINRLERIKIMINLIFFSPVTEEQKDYFISKLKVDKVNLKEVSTNEYNRVQLQVKDIETSINYKEKEVKNMMPQGDSKQMDMTKNLYQLGRILETNYRLKPSETTVKEYAMMARDADKQSKAMKNAK